MCVYVCICKNIFVCLILAKLKHLNVVLNFSQFNRLLALSVLRSRGHPNNAPTLYILKSTYSFTNTLLPVQQVIGGEKRPASVDISKKPKTPKKKKRKDPNEPVKPVSAYALFFRDTQANIKAQNPNATFGEVSKIVASMWDGLGEEQKQVGALHPAMDGWIYGWMDGLKAKLNKLCTWQHIFGILFYILQKYFKLFIGFQ